MEMKPTTVLLEARLRANPAYELVLFDRLSPSEQEMLGPVTRDPDGYGILRSREDAHLTAKSVSREMALLWFTLQSPGPLPRYAIQSLGRKCDQFIGQMVLDGILEIESGGRMVSGPAACALISNEPAGEKPDGALAGLSRRALEYAHALDMSDVVAVAARLYMYNRLPGSAAWRRLLPDQAAVERHLGIGTSSTVRLRQRGWTRVRSTAEGRGWIAWQSPQRRQDDDSVGTFKLYVSPACPDLRPAFQAAVDVAALSKAFYMKVGNDVLGLLRLTRLLCISGSSSTCSRPPPASWKSWITVGPTGFRSPLRLAERACFPGVSIRLRTAIPLPDCSARAGG
jgi:hypothetical protein